MTSSFTCILLDLPSGTVVGYKEVNTTKTAIVDG